LYTFVVKWYREVRKESSGDFAYVHWRNSFLKIPKTDGEMFRLSTTFSEKFQYTIKQISE